MKYLVRWKEYGAEHDKWLKQKKLDNAKDLLRDYYNTMFSAPVITPALRLLGTTEADIELTRRRRRLKEA